MPTIKNWNPSSDFGEDGLPNRDKANYPFWVLTLEEFLYNEADKDPRNQKILSGPANSDGDAKYYLDVFRLYPPDGYVALGDVIAAYPRSDGDYRFQGNNLKRISQTQGRLKIVFVKKSAGANAEPYAKQVFKGFVPPGMEEGCGVDLNRARSESGWAFTKKYYPHGFTIYNENVGYHNWASESDSSVWIWKGYDVDGGRYLTLGNSFAYKSSDNSINSNAASNLWAVRNDLTMSLKETDIDNDEYLLNTFLATNQKNGRLIVDSTDWGSGLNFSFYSTTMIFNRKRDDGSIIPATSPGIRTFLPTADGVGCERGGSSTWYGGSHGGWNFSSDDFKKYKYFLRLYMLVPYNSKNYCCMTEQSNLSTVTECGIGPFLTTPSSPVCVDFGRELCVSDKPNLLTGEYCLNKMCKTSPDSTNPLICDYEFSDFCKQQIDGKYINYERYPDVCACFMPDEFLKKACDDMATQLGIKNNPAAMKVLNIDTSDPDQCNQNCLNSLCGKTNIISSSFSQLFPKAFDLENGINRLNKTIVKGGIDDRTKCPDQNVCIQTATINNEGKVGDLEINQTIKSCGGYKDKRCSRSIFGKCEIHKGNGRFVKRLEKENDRGTCGKEGDEIECAVFTSDPIFDECNYGIRSTIYKQTKQDADINDVFDALNVYMPSSIQKFRGTTFYDEVGRYGFYMSECNDCEMGYEEKSECFLDGNIWKQKLTKTKVLNDTMNKGKGCVTDNTEVILNCRQDKDCVVEESIPDSGCKNGVREIGYKITSFNSGNGKTCRDAILEKVPDLFKKNYASVKMDADGKVAKAQISCEDCEIGYTIDRSINDGKCYYEESTKDWNIVKVPFMKKLPRGGGICGKDKLDILNNKERKIEKCSVNQDCEFNIEPIISECDETTGRQRLVFEVEKIANNKGLSCEGAALKLGSKYTNFSEDISYDSEKRQAEIITTCFKNQDCEIDFSTVLSNVCDTNKGLGVEVYRKVRPQKNKGKSCESLVKERSKERSTVIEDGNRVYIYRGCQKFNNEDQKKVMYIIIAVIVLITFISLMV